MATILIGTLHWMDWITINWEEIDEDLLHIYKRAKNKATETGFFARLKRMMIRTTPMIVGFMAGFKIAYFGSND